MAGDTIDPSHAVVEQLVCVEKQLTALDVKTAGRKEALKDAIDRDDHDVSTRLLTELKEHAVQRAEIEQQRSLLQAQQRKLEWDAEPSTRGYVKAVVTECVSKLDEVLVQENAQLRQEVQSLQHELSCLYKSLRGRRFCTPVSFSGTAPHARSYHSAVVHKDKMIMFGGWGDGIFNDLHEFDFVHSVWKEAPPADYCPAPIPRIAHTATITKDGSMIIFGGHLQASYYNDVHCYDAPSQRWQTIQVRGNPPSPRCSHTAVMFNTNMVIFGGTDGTNFFSDVYEFNTCTSEWTHRDANTAPSVRSNHSAVAHGDTMVVYGGHNGTETFGDVVQFSRKAGSWTTLDCSGTIPRPRRGHSAVVHHGNMLVFGGYDGAQHFSELHSLNLETGIWQTIAILAPNPIVPRRGHCLVVHEDTLVIHGGFNGQGDMGDLIRLSY